MYLRRHCFYKLHLCGCYKQTHLKSCLLSTWRWVLCVVCLQSYRSRVHEIKWIPLQKWRKYTILDGKFHNNKYSVFADNLKCNYIGTVYTLLSFVSLCCSMLPDHYAEIKQLHRTDWSLFTRHIHIPFGKFHSNFMLS